MSNIIEFPNKSDFSFRRFEKWFRRFLEDEDLTYDEITDILEEYKIEYSDLKPSFKTVINFPNDIGLSERQFNMIKIAIENYTDEIFEICNKSIVSCHYTILGLLARAIINSKASF